MDTPPAVQSHPTPTGLRRALNRVALGLMHGLPGPLRRRLGWWRWSEVLEGLHYARALDANAKGKAVRLPVARLLRRGLFPDARVSPWPKGFDLFHNNWNWESQWGLVPQSEIVAWSEVWGAHPKGQACLNQALVGLSVAGRVEAVNVLLSAGADPAASPPRGTFMERLWGAPLSAQRKWDVWACVCATGRQPPWSILSQQRQEWLCRMSAHDFEYARGLGVDLPTGEAALRFLKAWVHDPPLRESERNSESLSTALEAVRWLKEHGDLPLHASTVVLETWLQTARPSSDEACQKAVVAWFNELLAEGLPPRPGKGLSDSPLVPWSHWAAECPFFENLPVSVLEKLFDEPDALTATNRAGQDTHALFSARVHELRGQSRCPERLVRWLESQVLGRRLEGTLVPAKASIQGPRPRF